MRQWAGWGLRQLHVPIGVGGFAFLLFCLIVVFPCCCLPSMMMFVRFWQLLGREKEGSIYIPISSLKIVDSVYASQHCVAFVLGATQTKNQFSRVKIHALNMIQREYYISV